MLKTTWQNLDDVDRFAAALLEAIDGHGLTIALCGDLGAGKTQLVRSVAAAAHVVEDVSSPTFVLMQTYEAPEHTLVHTDFYRLASVDELDSVGLAEWFDSDAVVLVEWADKFPEYLPEDRLTIAIESAPDECRRVDVHASGPGSIAVAEALAKSLPNGSTEDTADN